MQITMSRSVTLASKVTLDLRALKRSAIYKVFVDKSVCQPISQQIAKNVSKEVIGNVLKVI